MNADRQDHEPERQQAQVQARLPSRGETDADEVRVGVAPEQRDLEE